MNKLERVSLGQIPFRQIGTIFGRHSRRDSVEASYVLNPPAPALNLSGPGRTKKAARFANQELVAPAQLETASARVSVRAGFRPRIGVNRQVSLRRFRS